MKRHTQLSCVGLTKNFQQREGTFISILKGITANFSAGKTYALMGVSGMGKSTFMHLLAGLDETTAGNILVDGKPLESLTSKEHAKTLGLVFQNPYFIKELTVLENVALAGEISGMSREKSRHEARVMLQLVGVGDTFNWSIGQLSGGQKQRVALARVLLNKPAFLLADELTGNLDAENGRALMDLLFSLQKEWGMGILISTHNPLIAAMMETVFVLQDGLLVLQN